MKTKFVADGPLRFLLAKKTALSEDIEKKYASLLVEANPVQKHQVRKQTAKEYLRRREVESHKPSAGTLW